MAGKEATVYIVDLGQSMGKKRHGRDETDLDWALEYVWDKITNTVSRRSFGDLVCIQD
jgi:ATP-dependent DNA helicase 2 subunit 2